MIDSWMTTTNENPQVNAIKPPQEKQSMSQGFDNPGQNPANPAHPDPMNPFSPMTPHPGQLYKEYGWLFGNMTGRRRN